MALLKSRHYKVAEAVKASLVDDVDLVAAIPELRWKIQKKAYHRNQSWLPGAYIVCMRRQNIPHENVTIKVAFPVLVAVVWPKDDDLTEDLEAELAFVERIEAHFNMKGRTHCPAPLLALDSVFTGSDRFNYEQTKVTSGEPFMDGAYAQGFDAIATVIEVICNVPKLDSSTLGA